MFDSSPKNRNIIAFSKRKLFIERDFFEILRYLYHIDKDNLKNRFQESLISISDTSDLKRIAEGRDEYANLIGFDLEDFLESYEIKPSTIKKFDKLVTFTD